MRLTFPFVSLTLAALCSLAIAFPAVAATTSTSATFATTAKVFVRTTPNGAAITTVPIGETGTLVNGPTYAGGNYWDEIKYSNGVTGWSASTYLKNTPTTTSVSASSSSTSTANATLIANLKALLIQLEAELTAILGGQPVSSVPGLPSAGSTSGGASSGGGGGGGTAPSPVPTLTLTALPTSVTSGGSTVLTWVTTNATSCNASGSWSGTQATAGSVTESNITTSSTYSLTCNGAGGSATQSVTVGVSSVAPTVTFTASPTSVLSGGSSTLTWSSTNATSCIASGSWSGTKGSSGSLAESNITATSTYGIACTGTGGTASSSVTVGITASPAPTPTLTFSASPTSVTSGGSSTLTWSTTNATSCTASGSWSGSKSTSGSVSETNLTANSTFGLSCTGTGGTASSSVSVAVTAPTPTVTFNASPASVLSGGSSTLTWSSTNATSCLASGSWSGTKGSSGSLAESNITATSTYTIACTGTGGTATSSAIVGITPPAPVAPTVTLSANPTSVTSGNSSTLTWSSTNATSCTPSGFSGSGTSGSVNVTPGSTTTYSITCTGTGGTSSPSSATVTVTANPAPTATISASPTSVTSGGSSTLTWSSTNATACTASGAWSGSKAASGSASQTNLTATSTYTIACTGTGGTATSSATVGVTQPASAPTVTISASPTSVSSGGSSTLTWSTTNATSCTASGSWSGTKATSGSAAQSNITANSTYALACTGAGGTASSSASVTVSGSTGIPAAATAAGYTLNTYSSTFSSSTVDFGLTYNRGYQWYFGNYFGWSPTPTTVSQTASLNSDGSINALSSPDYAVGLVSSAETGSWPFYTYVGTGYGGGGYFEATLKFDPSTYNSANGWPSWWLGDLDQALGLPDAEWVGQTNYYHFIEPDIFEYDGAGTPSFYGGNVHDWYGVYNSTCSGWCNIQLPWSSGTNGYVVRDVPTNTNFNTYHRYGLLWIPATSTTQGSYTYFFDGVQVGQPTYYSQFTNQTPPPSAASPWLYSIVDQHHLTLELGSALTEPMTVQSVNVWQATAANNLTSNTSSPVPTVTISANHTSVAYGGSSTITWSSTNATSCSTLWENPSSWTTDATNPWFNGGNKGTSGSQTVTGLTTTGMYGIYCFGPGGDISNSVTVNVAAAVTPTVTISASPTSVSSGGSSTLTWSSTNATSCTASGSWSGTQATSGTSSQTNITTSGTYTLTCTGAGGTSSPASATVTVSNVPPTVTLTATPTTITNGNSSTLTWSSTGATSCTPSGFSGSGTSGTASVSPTSTTNYSITCTGTGGTSSPSTATVTVNAASSAPSIASAVGYNTNTFSTDSNFTTSTFDKSMTYGNGFQWYPYNCFGNTPTVANDTLNGDGSITVGQDNNTYNAGISSIGCISGTPSYRGTAFGGGAYIQFVAKFPTPNNEGINNGWPSVWAWALEGWEGPPADSWGGSQASNVEHFIEADIMEQFLGGYGNALNQYSATTHDWYGVSHGSNVQNYYTTVVPSASTFSTYHTYAMLWVPATASVQGYINYYYDGTLEAHEPYNQYNATTDVPPPSTSSPWFASIIDNDHLGLIIGSANTNPITVQSVDVWQASAAKNLHN